MSRYGCDTRGKLNIFVWAILDSFPRTIRRIINPELDRKLQSFLDVLCRNIVVKVEDVKYSVPDSHGLYILSPEYERGVWKYLKPKKGEVFVDIGAHAGKYALQVAKIVGNQGLVIAVEPSPENYQALLTGIYSNELENILPLNIAAWKEDCKLKLFIGDVSGHHSIKKDMGFGYVEVEARAMDNVIEEVGINHVDWIKIDVEGAEVEVLEGLRNTLRKYAPKVIVEVLKENQKVIREFMEAHGYTVLPIKGLEGHDLGYFYCEKHS